MEDMVKTNIVETEKFTLPSGQEIEKENILALIQLLKKCVKIKKCVDQNNLLISFNYFMNFRPYARDILVCRYRSSPCIYICSSFNEKSLKNLFLVLSNILL